MRVPLQARDLFARAGRAEAEHVRLELRAQAKKILIEHRQSLQCKSAQDKVWQGRAISKSKKLHHMRKLALEDGTLASDPDEWAKPLMRFFSAKWGCNRLQERNSLVDFIFKAEGWPPSLTHGDLEAAILALEKRHRTDSYGVCVAVIAAFIQCCPLEPVTFFQRLVSSSPFMSSFSVPGLLYGKSNDHPNVSDIRGVFPLPAVLQVVDVLLSKVVQQIADVFEPKVPGAFIGARPKTQTLDIAHGVHLVLEKGLDCRSMAAAAQMDIAKYYDTISLVLVCL